MSAKYFIDSDGNYLGGFDGAVPPKDSIEVPVPPLDASAKWVGASWAEPQVSRDDLVKIEIVKNGYSTDLAVQALIRDKMGDSSMVDDLIKKINNAELKFPE